MRTIRRLAVLAALVALATPAVARADAVTDWNAIASTAIVTNAGQPPHQASLAFAMVQGAVYDAVNAITGGYRPYLARPVANPWDSQDAAAATAAYRVLASLFPSQAGGLQTTYAAYVAGLPDSPAGAKAGGVAAGEAAAAAMIAARTGDGRGGPFTFVFGTGPGEWRLAAPTFAIDPAPWVGNVRPFLINSPSQFRSDGPNTVTSAAYAADFNEVKGLGSLTSTTRTADETDAAIWWQDHGAALWNRIVRGLAAGLPVADTARLFARVDLAQADAAISCWNDKYYWRFWRPVTAIREAGSDGNPATVADPNWLPLFDPSTPVAGAPLVTPGFPDHPSGHGCVSGATVRVLQDFFGTDKVAFTAFSNKSQTTRSFSSLSRALREVINARVWAGIHFRTADVQGAVIGKKVARWEAKHYFQRVH
jgi:PAP2 superfamily